MLKLLNHNWLTIFLTLIAVIGCTADQQIQTLKPGVLTVAVTSGAPTNQYDPQLWIRQYVEQFAAEHKLTISWVVIPFNESWLLASRDEVDLVATNVANFPDRAYSGATFSAPFLYERRALRINPENQEQITNFTVTIPEVNNEIVDKLIKLGINVEIKDKTMKFFDYIMQLSPWILIILFWFILMRRMQGGMGTYAAAFAVGGATPNKANVESYNGTSWTEVNDLNTVRSHMGCSGTTTAGSMAVATGVLFTIAWFVSPKQGLISRVLRAVETRAHILREDILGLLWRIVRAFHGAFRCLLV